LPKLSSSESNAFVPLEHTAIINNANFNSGENDEAKELDRELGRRLRNRHKNRYRNNNKRKRHRNRRRRKPMRKFGNTTTRTKNKKESNNGPCAGFKGTCIVDKSTTNYYGDGNEDEGDSGGNPDTDMPSTQPPLLARDLLYHMQKNLLNVNIETTTYYIFVAMPLQVDMRLIGFRVLEVSTAFF